jgi:Fur family ferric uptake transcriptional regulator
MSASHSPAATEAHEPAARANLREHGLRATEARLLLLAAMADLEHPTVDALHRATASHGVALTTVYRTLDTLEAAGLVWAVHVPGLGRTYHLDSRHPHAHLLCRTCGRLDDLEALPADALQACGVPGAFAVDHVQLTVIGRCATCQAAGSSP